MSRPDMILLYEEGLADVVAGVLGEVRAEWAREAIKAQRLEDVPLRPSIEHTTEALVAELKRRSL